MDRAARLALTQIPDEDLRYAKDDELALYLRALELESHLVSPLAYAEQVSRAQRYRHIELLDRWIVALLEGRLYFDGPGPFPVENSAGILVHPTRRDEPVYNLAISMPPRHGKSYLVSEHLPAWFLTQYPQYSCLLASYEAQFAAEWGGKVRDHIVDHPEFGIEVEGGKNASRSMFNLIGYRGFMKCAGAGGPLTGSGGHLIIVDDPIKNAQDAMSAIERENLDNWWRSTLFTRREPWADGTPGRVILMSTRWHEDDLHGRRLPDAPTIGSTWAQLNLQALFEPTADQPEDPLGREPGAALCVERFTAEDLEGIRSESGDAWFQAMYQGAPSLDEGNIIKRPFRYYTLTDGIYHMRDEHGTDEYVEEEECYRFGTLDPAGTDKKYSDYTVLMVFDVTKTQPRRLMVRAVERVRMDESEHERRILEWYNRYQLKVLHVEDVTFGKNIISRLAGAPGVIVSKLKADKNKVWRAMPVDYEIRNGLVWFPEKAEWLRTFEDEVTKFPNTTHDDQVDTLAYGVQVFKNLPAWIERKREPVTMEERVAAHRKELARSNQRGRRNLPGIGRW